MTTATAFALLAVLAGSGVAIFAASLAARNAKTGKGDSAPDAGFVSAGDGSTDSNDCDAGAGSGGGDCGGGGGD